MWKVIKWLAVAEPVAVGTGETVWKGTRGNHSHLVGFVAALCSLSVFYSMALEHHLLRPEYVCACVSVCVCVCVCVCAHIFLPCQGFARLRDFKTGSCHYASALCWPPRGHSFPLWVLLWMLQCHVKMCYLDVHRILMRNFHRGPKPAEKKANKCTYSFFLKYRNLGK